MLRYTKERIYMVEERLLVSTTVLRFLLILVASYLFGLLFYYVLDREEKLHKKKRIDEIISLTIHYHSLHMDWENNRQFSSVYKGSLCDISISE